MQKFNYHQHTYRCKHADMDMKDEDYVKEYIKMGFEKIAFTDHCPQKNKIDKRTHMRMEYQEKDEYLKSIKELKEKYNDKIQIETGYEIEYIPGDEENLMELKKEANVIILGQHFIYDDNGNLKIFDKGQNFTDRELIRYAEYLDKAMELNIPDIIAHPDVFMNVRENFGEIDAKVSNMICKSAEKYNIPLEINMAKIFNSVFYDDNKFKILPIDEQREKLSKVRYPRREFWEIAKNYNIRVLYGIDSHHKEQILLFNELVQLANEILGDEIISKLNFIKDI
ncbi:MAG: histidinol-phosphatase [Clostridia bacterium]|nr:histidinol-phosphatase [Clostridia bacterium]